MNGMQGEEAWLCIAVRVAEKAMHVCGVGGYPYKQPNISNKPGEYIDM